MKKKKEGKKMIILNVVKKSLSFVSIGKRGTVLLLKTFKLVLKNFEIKIKGPGPDL